MADDAPDTTVPLEIVFSPMWDGSDMPLPDDRDASDVAFSIVAVYPLNSDWGRQHCWV